MLPFRFSTFRRAFLYKLIFLINIYRLFICESFLFFRFCRVFRKFFNYTAVTRLAVEFYYFLDELTLDKIESVS